MIQKLLLTMTALIITACSSNTNVKPKGINSKEIIIYYIHREHCPGCEYMDEVLKDKEIQKLLSNGYRLIVLDVNNQESLPANLEKTRTTPTFYFVDNSNRKVAKDEHVLNPQQFKQKLLGIKR